MKIIRPEAETESYEQNKNVIPAFRSRPGEPPLSRRLEPRLEQPLAVAWLGAGLSVGLGAEPGVLQGAGGTGVGERDSSRDTSEPGTVPSGGLAGGDPLGDRLPGTALSAGPATDIHLLKKGGGKASFLNTQPLRGMLGTRRVIPEVSTGSQISTEMLWGERPRLGKPRGGLRG